MFEPEIETPTLDVHDLLARLRRGDQELRDMADTASYREDQSRLRGKAAGLRLAISYIEEMAR